MCRVIRLWFVFCSSALLLSLPSFSEDLITCGWDEIRALRLEGTSGTTLWTWAARNSNLPEWAWPLFDTTDECKPCPGDTLLITSSGGASLNGAVALVHPKTSNVLFYARAPNAHSADLLPSNRVAVAFSYQTNGNRLAVFDLSQSDEELFSVNLFGAHGVVWDTKRQVLWGMADTFIREYELLNWNTPNPQLREVRTTSLPEIGGHDMYPILNSPYLTITTGQHCWLFNRDSRTFVKHPLLGDISGVKGMCVNPVTGRIVYVKAEVSWWSENLRFADPDGVFRMPGQHFYKARWLTPELLPLSIESSAGQPPVILWPSLWSGYVLQQNTNLITSSWVAVADPVVVIGTNNTVSPTNIVGQCFYRLRKAD